MGGWELLERLGFKVPPLTDARVETFFQASTRLERAALTDLPEARALLATSGTERVELVKQCATLFQRHAGTPSYFARQRTQELFDALAESSLPYADDDLAILLRLCSDGTEGATRATMAILRERFAERDLPSELARACTDFLKRLVYPGPENRKLRARLERLLLPVAERDRFKLTRADGWSAQLLDLLDELEPDEHERLLTLLVHAEHPSGSKPSKSWQKRAGELILALGLQRFNVHLVRVLEHVGVDSGVPALVPTFQELWGPGDPTLVSALHADLLKGLIWAAGPSADAALVQAIGDAAERCFKKVPGVGPRAPKIGNACLQALTIAKAPNAVSQLSRLQGRVKHNSSRAQVERALSQVAERSGVSRDELEDMAASSCGLTSVGRLDKSCGDYAINVRVDGLHEIDVAWLSPGGRPQKSTPSAVKTHHAAELAELKLNLKELEQQLPAQARRIESMLLSQRTLQLRDFQQLFVRHPLLGFLSRRLLWRAERSRQVFAIVDNELVDIAGYPVRPADDERIALWHPLHSPTDDVLAWRSWLEAQGITQPFKQAHREIYVLTDAERQTQIYSNRFAAHVLKQHQFHALCRERGWHYTLQGGFDSHNTPHLLLPAHDLRVEYWVDAAGGAEATMSEAGIYLYVATDQVRFQRLAEAEPLGLERVPPLVFSELMRDVDLFVGVCSVGNDPNWQTRDEQAPFANYWQGYAFGDLNETAKTRRSALARLLPKLKIAQACQLEERFLVVRGRLRTYRIHLGSANIQMEPGNQYLCIVPGRSAKGAPPKVMLPFEGDSTLSVILSKAILLAEDHKITDPSIQNQIGAAHYRN
jgi:hypothetical protein